MPVEGGKIENLTKDNMAADSGPQFSPDGKWLAYRAQKRPGFEADRWDLMVLPADGKGDGQSSLTAEIRRVRGCFRRGCPIPDASFSTAKKAVKHWYFVDYPSTRTNGTRFEH